MNLPIQLIKKIFPFVILLFFSVSSVKVYACSPFGTPTLSSQNISGSTLNLVWQSTTGYTCSYWIKMEIVCSNQPFTGNPNYTSACMNKPSTSNTNYPSWGVPIGGLCPGVTYKMRAKECSCNSTTSCGGWSTTYTFTVPSTISPLIVTANASATNICTPNCATLTAGVSGGCGPFTYSWSPGGQTSQSISVCPTVNTTYSVTVQDICAGQNATGSVTINVLPPPVAGTASVNPSVVCSGQPATLTLTGSQGTIQWQSGPSSTGPWTNISGATTTPFTTPGLTAPTCFQAVVSGCGPIVYSNAVCVTITPIPTVTVSNAAICNGQSATLTATPGITGGTYAWNSGQTSQSITISPSSTTSYSVVYTLNGCPSASVPGTVTVNPLPVLAVSPAAPSVCIGTSVTLTASGASAYTWSPAGSLNASTGATVIATPNVTTTYTVTGTDANGCVNTTSVTVTVNPLPVVAISPANPTICNGGSVTLTASGANTYSWSPSTALSATAGASVTASPTATTTYTIIGTSAYGCTNTSQVTVTVTTLPVISVTPANPVICIGSSIMLTAAGAATYSWSPATGLSAVTGTSVNANPIATTTYTVTGTDGGGCVNSTTVTVTVNPLPVIGVTPAASIICVGASVTLTASGASIYSWSNSNTLSSSTGTSVSATPTSNSSYTVTGIDANGCIDSASAFITVNSLPLVTVNSATICSGTSATLNASGASTYSWSNAGTLSSSTGATVAANPTTTTSYIVTGTDANSCVNTDTSVVTVNALPTIVLTPPSAVICFGDAVALSASGANTYSWTPGAGLSATTGSAVSASPTTTTTYTVTGTDNNLCVNSSTIQVTVNPLPNVSVNAVPPAICEGASTTLTASGADIYSWTPSSTLNSSTGNIVTASPTDTTLYTITGTNTSTGCINTANINIIVYPLPSISVTTSSDTICMGQTAILTASGGAAYFWTPAPGLTAPSGNPVTVSPSSPNTTNTYTVTGYSNQQCPGSATVDVYVNPSLNVIALSDASICIGKNVQISAFATGGDSNYSYSWMPPIGLSNPSIANPVASPSTTTMYTVNVYDDCNTPQASASVTITVNPLPVIAFQADTNKGCVPLTLQFNNLSNSSASCLWDFGDGSFESNCNPSHIFENVGNYDVSLSVTDTNGCQASLGNFPIQVNPYPVALFTMSPQPTTILNPMIFFNSDSSSADVSSWWWDFAGIGGDSIPNPEYLFPDTGSYDVQLMVVNEFGCYDSITQRVIILGDYTIYIPNAFTPNNDGINEFWGPKGAGISEENFEMLIFNRWGQLIYSTNDINKPWNGIPRDGSLISQQEVYIYKITIQDSFQQKHRYQGHFSLIR